MTLPVFPDLDGIDIEGSKKPEFKTSTFEALSGREKSWKLRQFPKYTFTLSVGALLENAEEAQLQELMGFMLSMEGTHGRFLFNDARDNNLTVGWSAAGDGTTTAYQLKRSLGGYVEPVENLNGSPAIYLDGELQESGYTVGGTGIVTFGTAPAVGAVITWVGLYYYRCRFAQEGYSFDRLLSDLHECRDIDFVGSIRSIL